MHILASQEFIVLKQVSELWNCLDLIYSPAKKIIADGSS